MYSVYALSNEIRSYIYVGFINNLERRISEHNKGYEKTTRPYRPFRLIYEERCDDRITARAREKFFKSGKGKEFLKLLK